MKNAITFTPDQMRQGASNARVVLSGTRVQPPRLFITARAAGLFEHQALGVLRCESILQQLSHLCKGFRAMTDPVFVDTGHFGQRFA